MLSAYLAERVPPRVFFPLAIILAAAAAEGIWGRPRTLAIDAALALLLLAQYRIWDDLADRHHDAIAHPGRVLVQAASTTSAIALCLALAAASLTVVVARDGAGLSLATLIGLTGVLGAWYGSRGARTTAGDHLLLTKYPAIVLIVSGDRVANHPARLLCTMAAVYLAACVYEAWHDPSSPAAGNRLLVACEATLLVLVTFAAWSFGGHL